MADNADKLTNHGDRVLAVIECAGCGHNVQVSGDTFAVIEEKLRDADACEYSEGFIVRCGACTGKQRPTDRDEIDE